MKQNVVSFIKFLSEGNVKKNASSTLPSLLYNAIAHAGVIALLTAIQVQGQVPSPRDTSIIDPAARIEMLFDGQFRTEGPSVGFDGTIYFVDLDIARGGRIWRYDPRTKQASVLRSPSGLAAGSAIDPKGNLLTAELASGGGRRITLTEIETGRTSILVDRYEGKPLHGVNDLVLDATGRIYFTEYALLGPGDVLYRRGSGVYRIDLDGTLRRIIDDAGVPNGIAVSPDQHTLYVGTNRFDVLGNGAILAYDLSAEGEVRFRSVLIRYDTASLQLADGMDVDVDGNLYVALFSTRGKTGVAVYAPDGVERVFIPTPGPATNVTFGLEPDARSLYITAATGLYRLHVKHPGYHPAWRQSGQSRSTPR